jgi:ribonuclease P protein component
LNGCFPKKIRLLKSAEFKRVYDSGFRKTGMFLQLIGCKNDLDFSRFGISVGKKHGNAVERNRWKRRIREIIRNNQCGRRAAWDVVVQPRLKAEIPAVQSLEQDFKGLLAALEKKEVGNRTESNSRRSSVL